MGICSSSDAQLQQARNRDIEKEIVDERRQKKIKLLLLGPAECGKSTVLKQMRLMHDQGFTEEEMEQQRRVVYSNVFQSIVALLRAAQRMELTMSGITAETKARAILDAVKAGVDSGPFDAEMRSALRVVWTDAAIQATYARRSEFQLIDCAKYFLDDIDRISAEDYRPSSQDILYTRVPTNGIVEVNFLIKGVTFRVFDVGGQRSERRKWIHCFDDVNAIIFLAAVSEYDQKIIEDDKTNRIVEALNLFKEICNSKWFSVKVSMILFLNKTDLFVEKLPRVPLTVAFEEYTGGQSYEEAITFLEDKFEEQNENKKKRVYMHETCATDTNQVQLVLDSVLDTIMANNLQNAGML